LLSFQLCTSLPFLFYFFFRSSFYHSQLKRQTKMSPRFHLFGRKIRKMIRCGLIQLYGRSPHSLTLFSVFFLFPLAGPSTQHAIGDVYIYGYTHGRCARSLICQPLPCCCCCCCCCC
jgi:hypothetical protein